jgi:hypothetical protein
LKPTKRFSKPIILAAITATLVACGQAQPSLVSPAELSSHANQADSTLGSLELRIAGLGGRRVLATVADIVYLDVTITYPATGHVVSRRVDAAALRDNNGIGRVNFNNLPAGNVTVKVEAFDVAGLPIGNKTENAEVKAMQPTYVTVPLKLIDTIIDSLNGNLGVNINVIDGTEVTASPSPLSSATPELPPWSPSPAATTTPSPEPTDTPTTVPTASVAPTTPPSPVPSVQISTPPDSTVVHSFIVPQSDVPLFFSMRLNAYFGGSQQPVERFSDVANVMPGTEVRITVSEFYGWYGNRSTTYTAYYIDGGYPFPSSQKSTYVSWDYNKDNGDFVSPMASGCSNNYGDAAAGRWNFFPLSP